MPIAIKKPIIAEDTQGLKATETLTTATPTAKKSLICNYELDVFDDMIDSIIRALEFFQLYVTELVVDAAVGTRILQGTSVLFLLVSINAKKRCQTFLFENNHRPTSANTTQFQFAFGHSKATGADPDRHNKY